MIRVLLIGLLVAGALPFSRGADRSAPRAETATKSESGREPVAGAAYVLQPLDLIKIQVYKEPELSGEWRISQDGKVELNFINTVDLTNKTVRQAEELIRTLYDKDYLVNPQVKITVMEYTPRRVEVFGMVANPGVVLFPKEEGLTLTAAISLAGSFTRLANKKAVTLKRAQPDGTFKVYTINVDELTTKESGENWPLQPGDVIYVPERLI